MKCKLNDLCFVIKCKEHPSHIGKVVETSEYYGYFIEGEYLKFPNHNFVVVVTDHYWIVEGKTEGSALRLVIPDSWLLPFGDEVVITKPTEPIEDSEISSKELEFN